MWGIEFFDDAEKSRRSVKASPKTTDYVSRDKKEEKAGAQDPSLDSRSEPGLSVIRADEASADHGASIELQIVSPEQAQSRLKEVNEETQEEKIGDRVTNPGSDARCKHNMASHLRDESIDEGYVLVGHKEICESEDMLKPGIVTSSPLKVDSDITDDFSLRLSHATSLRVTSDRIIDSCSMILWWNHGAS